MKNVNGGYPTRNEEVAALVAGSEKRLNRCVPLPLRSQFESELAKYVALKIEENALGGRKTVVGFSAGLD